MHVKFMVSEIEDLPQVMATLRGTMMINHGIQLHTILETNIDKGKSQRRTVYQPPVNDERILGCLALKFDLPPHQHQQQWYIDWAA